LQLQKPNASGEMQRSERANNAAEDRTDELANPQNQGEATPQKTQDSKTKENLKEQAVLSSVPPTKEFGHLKGSKVGLFVGLCRPLHTLLRTDMKY
jgi:hypothetical protein